MKYNARKFQTDTSEIPRVATRDLVPKGMCSTMKRDVKNAKKEWNMENTTGLGGLLAEPWPSLGGIN